MKTSLLPFVATLGVLTTVQHTAPAATIHRVALAEPAGRFSPVVETLDQIPH